MNDYCIETHDLSRHFGDKAALDKLCLAIPYGGIHAIVGSNGAGKSTLFRLLLGIDTPDHGSAKVLGEPCTNLSPRLRGRIGYVNEEHSLPKWMQVSELVAMQQSFYPNWHREIYDQVIAWFDVNPLQRISALSRGERAGLNLSMALAQRPEVLILDEPTLGLDIVAKQSFLEALMLSERADNATVIYCSHQMEEIERVADRLILLEKGQLKNNSPPDDFCSRVRYWTSATPLKDWSIPGLLTSRSIEGRQHILVVDQDDSFSHTLHALGGTDIKELSVSLDRAVNAFLSANHSKPKSVS